MGKSLSKSNKIKSQNPLKSIGDQEGDSNNSKKKVKPPKFAVNKPKTDKLERDLKRASKKRKRSATKECLENMKPLPPPTVPHKLKTDARALSEQEYDEMAVVKMKNLIVRDCVLFLLNQLLLSVQFYTNFER